MSIRLEKCGSCSALMFWAVSERDKPIPMDPLPIPGGNMALRWAGGHLTARVVPENDRAGYDGPLYQTHFLTCPFAGHHRSNRRREPQ
jgi:hypothetical protein